jgi:hypothetical protein
MTNLCCQGSREFAVLARAQMHSVDVARPDDTAGVEEVAAALGRDLPIVLMKP